MARQVDIVLTLNATGVVTGGKAGAAGVKGIEQQAKQTEKALGRMARQGKKAGQDIGRTMRSGRAGALSLNRIVQDMPFGFIAIQNNVTELAASFTVMKQNGLSGAEAIKSILSQFKGPGGFLFIISAAVALITAFGGKMVEAFNKGKTSAKELTEALDTLLTIQRDLDKFQISAEDIEAKLLRTRELIANVTQKTHKFTVLLAGATVSVTDAEREALKIDLDRLNGLKALEKQLEKELETSKALAIELEVLAAVGADLVVEKDEVTRVTRTGTTATKEATTAFQRAQEEVIELTANLKSLEAAGIEPLAALQKEAMRLRRDLERIAKLILALADPQKVGPLPIDADATKEQAEEQGKALQQAQLQLRVFSDASIEEIRRLVNEAEAASNKINFFLAAIANAEVVEETLGNFAGAFGDIAGVRQEAIERELDRENAALENSLDERTQRLIEAGVSEVEARRRANQQINNLQEQNAKQAADAINRQFRIQKAFAVAEAVVATFNAANKALASAPPPFSFALMASTIAVGLANVAAILAARPGGSPTGGGARGGAAAGASSTPVGLGGIRVQNRGFTIGATGAAPGERAPMDLRIEVIEKDLFTINVLLKNADGVREQVGSI